MARVENDTSDSEDNDDKLDADEDVEDGNMELDKDDSDDESITSEDEDESMIEQKISEMEEKIFSNPYDYKNHVELISLLGQLGDRSRLRSAYERLTDLFPLASKQWLSWLQLEVNSVSTPEGREKIYKLFDNAFQDCYCGAIYMEWCAMSMSSEEEARNILPQALEAAGSDPLDGSLLWDTAKEFELAHLSVMSSSSSPNPQTFKKQVGHVVDVFVNQLSRPLFRSESLLDEFREFAESRKEHIPDMEETLGQVQILYVESEKILKKLLDFENELETIPGKDAEEVQEKCAIYKRYISHVNELIETRPDANDYYLVELLNILYDRATTECSASLCRLEDTPSLEAENLCQDYVEFSRNYLSSQKCLKVIGKVIKRCPRKCSLWVAKLQQIEKMGYDLERIKSEFETALYGGFHSALDYVNIWLCYLEALRRKTDFSLPEEVDRLRKTFRLSWDSLGQMWGNTADIEFVILQFWARIEYQHTKDHDFAKELFDEIFDYGDNRLRGGLWLEFINLEKQRGSGSGRVRGCFKRAVKNSADPRLQRAWQAFERDHGTLNTLMECNRACAEKAKEWEASQSAIKQNTEGQKTYKNQRQTDKSQFNEGKAATAKNNKKKKKQKSPGKGKQPSDNADKQNRGDGRHTDSSDGVSNRKRKFESADGEGFDKETNKSNKMAKEEDATPQKTEICTSETTSGAKRKINERDAPSKRLKPDNKLTSGPPPGYESFKKQQAEDEDQEKNSRTAFVSNLDFKVDEEELRSKLIEYGDIDELRLVKGVKAFGSICYCVYKDPNSVLVALSHDRTLLGIRPMFISRYCATKDSRQKHFIYPTSIERNKLFVKNIAFEHCTQGKLTEIFGKYGDLKEIRIVLHKNGNPKGLAYVDYANEKSANAALQGTDGQDVGGRALSVAISAPPPKKRDPPQLGAFTPQAPSATRGHARTMLFVPSVLRKPAPSTAAKTTPTPKADETIKVSTGDTASDSSSKLSNSDFRNMLLGMK